MEAGPKNPWSGARGIQFWRPPGLQLGTRGGPIFGPHGAHFQAPAGAAFKLNSPCGSIHARAACAAPFGILGQPYWRKEAELLLWVVGLSCVCVCVCVCVRVFRSSVLSLLRFASISLKAKISCHEQSAANCNVEGLFLNNNIAEAATMCNIPLVFKIRVKK